MSWCLRWMLSWCWPIGCVWPHPGHRFTGHYHINLWLRHGRRMRRGQHRASAAGGSLYRALRLVLLCFLQAQRAMRMQGLLQSSA